MTDAERRIVLGMACLLLFGALVRAWRGDDAGAGRVPGPSVAIDTGSTTIAAVHGPADSSRSHARTVDRKPIEPIDINSADAAALMTLPGIGPSKARAILEERARRRFRNTADLLRVRGIGPATLARLRPFVRVVQSATSPHRASLPRAPTGR